MRRREFITLLGGAAAGWPLAAHAQQPDRAKRIGALMSTAAEDPEGQARMTAFQQKLQQLGWIDGGNVRIDARWSASDAERMRRGAEELVALSPDVILASGGTVLGPLLRPHAPCQSCSHRPPTRSAPASLRAWRGRAAMPPDSPSSNWNQLEMAGPAQGGCASRDTGGGSSRFRPYRRGSGSSLSSKP